MSVESREIRGYLVRTDRAHDPDTHLWVEVRDDARVRVGLDPLGVETSGTLAQLAMVEVGTIVVRGEPFGSLEAEKFVGPLVAPVSGTVVARNDAVLADPGLVERDPYDSGWLAEIEPSALDADLGGLVAGGDVAAWFESKVEQYRREGVLAE